MADNIITLGIDPKDIKSLEDAESALTRLGTAAGLTDKELKDLSKSVAESVKSIKSLDVAKSPFSAMAANSKELIPHLQQANKELQQTAKWNTALLSNKVFVNQITDTKALIITQQRLNSEIEKQAVLKANLREEKGLAFSDLNLRRAKEETEELEKQLTLIKRKNSVEAPRDRLRLLLEEKEVEKGMAAIRAQGLQAGKDLRAEQTRGRIKLLLEEKEVEKGMAAIRARGLQAGKDLRAEQIRKRIKLLLEEKAVEKGMADLRSRGIKAGEASRATTEAVKAKDAAKKLKEETKGLTEAQKIQHGVVRGLSGGMGALWLSYGQSTAAIAAMGVAYSITTVAVQEFNSAIDLDYLTRYAAAIDDTSTSFTSMQDSLLSISGVASGPVELAGGLRELVKAGLEADDVMKGGLLKTLSKFATVAELDMTEATRLAVTQVKAFGDITKESTGITLDYTAATEQMVAAVFSAPIAFDDLANALPHLAELAVTVRASFDEILTALSLMGEAGIRGTKAATGLRTGLTKLVTPGKQVQEVFDAVGVSISDAFDEKGNLDVKKGLELFKQVFDQLDAVSKVKFAKDTFGLKAQKLLSILNGLDEWDARNLEIRESAGSIEVAYAKIRDSLKIAKSEFSAAFTSESAKKLIPVVEALTKVVQFATDNMKVLLTAAEDAAIGITKAFTPFLHAVDLLKALDFSGAVSGQVSDLTGEGAKYFENLLFGELEPLSPELLATLDLDTAEAEKQLEDIGKEGLKVDLGLKEGAKPVEGINIEALKATGKALEKFEKLKASVGSLMSAADWEDLEKAANSFEDLSDFSGDFITRYSEESSTAIGKLEKAFDDLGISADKYFKSSSDARKGDTGKEYFKALETAAKAYITAQKEVKKLNQEISRGEENLSAKLRELSRVNASPLDSRKAQLSEIRELEDRAKNIGESAAQVDTSAIGGKTKYNELIKEQIRLLEKAATVADSLGSSAESADKGLVAMAKAEYDAAKSALSGRNIQENRERLKSASAYYRELSSDVDAVAAAKNRLAAAEKAVQRHNTSQTREAVKSAADNYNLVKSLDAAGAATDKLSVAKLRLTSAEKRLGLKGRSRSKEAKDTLKLVEAERKLARAGSQLDRSTTRGNVEKYREAYREYEKLYNAQKAKSGDAITKEAALKEKMEEVRRVAEEILNVKREHSTETQGQIDKQAEAWGIVGSGVKSAEDSVKNYTAAVVLAAKESDNLYSITTGKKIKTPNIPTPRDVPTSQGIPIPEVDQDQLVEVGKQMEATWVKVKEALEAYHDTISNGAPVLEYFLKTTVASLNLINEMWATLAVSVTDYIQAIGAIPAVKVPSTSGEAPSSSKKAEQTKLIPDELPKIDPDELSASIEQINSLWKDAEVYVKDYHDTIYEGAPALQYLLKTTSGSLGLIDDMWTAVTRAVDKYSDAIRAIPAVTPPQTAAAPGRALGGDVSAGQPYTVGEVGKELFIPNVSGTIVPNNKLGTNEKSSNKTVDINLNFNGEAIKLQGTQPNVDSFVASLETLKRRAA